MESHPFKSIELSATAKSKTFRMYRPHAIKRLIRAREGRLYRKGDTNEYHLITDAEPLADEHEESEWVIAFAVKDEKITVITQMHRHCDYSSAAIYERVPTPFEHSSEASSASA